MSPTDLPALGSWLISGDTGISSKTMAGIALGGQPDTTDWCRQGDAPYDPSDFERCYRLMQAVPSIRDDFDRIAAAVPVFAAILREWDSLCAIYLRDLPTGGSDELYQRLKALRKEGETA